MKLRWTSLLAALTLAGGCDFAIGVTDAPISLAVPDRANAHAFTEQSDKASTIRVLRIPQPGKNR